LLTKSVSKFMPKKFYEIALCDLCYKSFMIVNYASVWSVTYNRNL
jgi:hypothetical protein